MAAKAFVQEIIRISENLIGVHPQIVHLLAMDIVSKLMMDTIRIGPRYLPETLAQISGICGDVAGTKGTEIDGLQNS